ncbi:MAG: hypothetical protein E6J86_18770 [Deltaproteobacteria bacterium]|nr:MAG: hypothetical protein E6J86_18770 [Deltaproteobacteria bacterium]
MANAFRAITPKEDEMKTLPMIAVLVPLLAACGSATRANSQAVETECSYELPAGADALDVR